MSNIYDLLTEVSQIQRSGQSAEWWDKMAHPIPKAVSIDRSKYILDWSKDKVVLDVGCTGPMAAKLREVVAEYHGIDIVDDPGFKGNYYKYDLDSAVHLPPISNLDLIIAGEVLEHLSNPGNFLTMLKEYGVPVILTTPNAFSKGAGDAYLHKGIEIVNGDHTAWYSYTTLFNLITRHGFRLKEWFWYNGKPIFAEGIIFNMEPVKHGTA